MSTCSFKKDDDDDEIVDQFEHLPVSGFSRAEKLCIPSQYSAVDDDHDGDHDGDNDDDKDDEHRSQFIGQI